MRVTDAQIQQVFDRGYAVVRDFLDPETLARAQAATFELFPRPEDYFADPSAHPRFARSQFAGQKYFPFRQPALNALVTHPDLIDAAERFCGTDDIELYKVELWAKYAGAVDYDQRHHRDFGNHTIVAPKAGREHAQMTTFILLSDVTAETGPTAVVPLEHTRDLPLTHDELPPGAFADLEELITAPAGTLFIYKTDVVHRGTDLTGPGASRFVLLVDFQRRGQRWRGKQSWPDHAIRPGWVEAMTAMSPRARDLFGWPPPGDPYWDDRTLVDVQLRYPAMDLSPYRPRP